MKTFRKLIEHEKVASWDEALELKQLEDNGETARNDYRLDRKTYLNTLMPPRSAPAVMSCRPTSPPLGRSLSMRYVVSPRCRLVPAGVGRLRRPGARSHTAAHGPRRDGAARPRRRSDSQFWSLPPTSASIPRALLSSLRSQEADRLVLPFFIVHCPWPNTLPAVQPAASAVKLRSTSRATAQRSLTALFGSAIEQLYLVQCTSIISFLLFFRFVGRCFVVVRSTPQ